jgi:diguanylate cyclase
MDRRNRGAWVTTQRSFDETLHIAEAAMGHMRSYGIPMTPENFTVWYHYAGNSYPDLKRAIDILVRAHDGVTAPASAELFERFFANAQENDSVRDAIARMEEVMQRAAQDLSQAGQGAAAFGDALQSATGVLSNDGRAGTLEQVVQGIVQATRQMEARSRELEQRLDAASNEVSQLKDEVEAMRLEATTDALTGLANRKRFDARLREESEEAKDSKEPLSLLMLDLDHFKRFNDNHGHLIGDHVLRLLSEVMQQSVKGRDIAARFGGEEFAIILPATPLIHAKSLGNAIREKISKKVIVNRVTGLELGQITLSIGAAQYRPEEPMAEFIERADAALYRAKKSGRNRVITELENPEPELALGR